MALSFIGAIDDGARLYITQNAHGDQKVPTLRDMMQHATSYEGAHHAAKKSSSFTAPLNDEVSEISGGRRAPWSAKKPPFRRRHDPNQSTSSNVYNGQNKPCTYCGRNHQVGQHARSTVCRAWGQTCTNCGKPNHYQIVCRQPRSTNQTQHTPNNTMPRQPHQISAIETDGQDFWDRNENEEYPTE